MFHKSSSKVDGRVSRCKICVKTTRKPMTVEQLSSVSKSKKIYYQKNKKKINERKRVYFNERKKKDPSFKLIVNLRNRLYFAFKGISKSKSTTDLLGGSIEQAMLHIENLFKSNMSWDNYGEWQIDHIVPLASVASAEEKRKLCHYTNLQPLWKEDHFVKTTEDIKNIKLVKSTTYQNNSLSKTIL